MTIRRHREESSGQIVNAAVLRRWIVRGMEGVWLLAAFLIPLAFLDRDFIVSEAVIAYVEVPKIALLRTLAGAMACLWLLEWGIGNAGASKGDGQAKGWLASPGQWPSLTLAWLREQPTRWIYLAVGLFTLVTALTTMLSASWRTSLWGEIPGQDSSAAYTVAAYVAIFWVTATHLKTMPQMQRLMGVIIASGFLISIYGVLQNYGLDPFRLTEGTGGGGSRITTTTGNAVFAGAAIMMPLVLTVIAAAINLSPGQEASRRGRDAPRKPQNAHTKLAFWTIVLAVQTLGLLFTFSRGPWVGGLAAIAVFLGVQALTAGWLAVGRIALVLGLAGAAALGAVMWPGLPAIASLAGFGMLLAAYVVWTTVVRPRTRPVIESAPASAGWGMKKGLTVAALVGLAGVVIVVGAVLAPSLLGGNQTNGGPSDVRFGVAGRIASIGSEVVTGAISGRTRHWIDSWALIEQHPWFSFAQITLPGLRSIIGYGPDLLRFTYLLVTPPSTDDLLPVEPDNAHNFFIHQWVEQGFLGFIASGALFLAPLTAGAWMLLRRSAEYTVVQRILLGGLLALLAGRLVEQMVGVAKVSDLIMFWACLAMLTALPVAARAGHSLEERGAAARALVKALDVADNRGLSARVFVAGPAGGHLAIQHNVGGCAVLAADKPVISARNARRRSSSTAPATASPYNWQLFLRLAVAAWLMGGIISLTWIKTLAYPRAAAAAGAAFDASSQGDLQAALTHLDRAIALAPDVPVYYGYEAEIYALYRENKGQTAEAECSNQPASSYDNCLAQRAYFSNKAALSQQPFYWRSRLALADSALFLEKDDEAVRLYRETIAMVPASWPIRNRLAEAYLAMGRPEEALAPLQESLAITGETSYSRDAYFFQGQAYHDLHRSQESVQSLRRSLELGLGGSAETKAKKWIAEMGG